VSRRQGRWLTMGGVALAAWAGLGLLRTAPDAWSWADLANAVFLLVAAGLAVASTARAAGNSRASERLFWILLGAAAAVGGISQGLAATGALGASFWQRPLPVLTGAYLPTVLMVAALLMRPHRSHGVALPLAALDGLLVATCAAFLISYGLMVPQPRLARGLHLAADALPLFQSLLLGLTVRDNSFRRVYRLLAAGFALRAGLDALLLIGASPEAAWPAPAASWAPVLVFVAVAALEPAAGVWIAGAQSERVDQSVGRLAVFLVAFPPLIDGGVRSLSAGAAGGSVRSQLAMAATVLLALLAAARVRLGRAATRAAETPSDVPSDEESGRFLAFAAGVAHQVNNRLNIVAGWSQVAVRRGEGDRAALDALMAAVREASDAAGQFQRLAAMRRDEEGS
jgi:hypothetical protein